MGKGRMSQGGGSSGVGAGAHEGRPYGDLCVTAGGEGAAPFGRSRA